MKLVIRIKPSVISINFVNAINYNDSYKDRKKKQKDALQHLFFYENTEIIVFNSRITHYTICSYLTKAIGLTINQIYSDYGML